MSISERKSLKFFRTLPVSIVPTQSFEPRRSKYFFDSANEKLIGKPDAVAIQPRGDTHIECKKGKLNDHRDKASCQRAMMDEYSRRMHDAREKPYNFLADFFYATDTVFSLENSWNNSLWKVLALQSLHGWENYVVCFADNPKADDAKRYTDAGLVFCTNATLGSLLATIDLRHHGVYFPFTLRAPRSGYTISLDSHPDPELEGLTEQEVVKVERTKFLASVAAAKQAMEEITF